MPSIPATTVYTNLLVNQPYNPYKRNYDSIPIPNEIKEPFKKINENSEKSKSITTPSTTQPIATGPVLANISAGIRKADLTLSNIITGVQNEIMIRQGYLQNNPLMADYWAKIYNTSIQMQQMVRETNNIYCGINQYPMPPYFHITQNLTFNGNFHH